MLPTVIMYSMYNQCFAVCHAVWHEQPAELKVISTMREVIISLVSLSLFACGIWSSFLSLSYVIHFVASVPA